MFLATKTHRDHWREAYGVSTPEVVACVTAHASIDKACDLLGIRLVKVSFDPSSFRAPVEKVKAALTANTVMIYASAPQYPHGVIDDVESLSRLALSANVGLHVDCCLGGFVLPFAQALIGDESDGSSADGSDGSGDTAANNSKKKNPFGVPRFDFSLPGVSSMSVDTHKYGYASKGTSCVVYRSQELRRSQYFTYADCKFTRPHPSPEIDLF